MEDDFENDGSKGFVAVDRPTAEAEFERLSKSWKIKNSKGESGAEESVIEAIMDGIVMIKNGPHERLVIVQKIDEQIGEHTELTYRFPLASDMMQMDNFKDGQNTKKAGAMVASVTGVGDKMIAKMGGVDFTLAQAIAFCFLGV